MNQEFASFWSRAVAASIDGIIVLLLGWLSFYGALYGIYLIEGYLTQWESHLPFQDSFDAFRIQFYFLFYYTLLEYVYFGWFTSKTGQTPGKKWLKLKIVDEASGELLSWSQISVRFLGYYISYLPLGVGYLMALFHPNKRALHDLISKTVVISE